MSDERIAALCIERWELSAIKHHPKNPRTHPPQGSKKWEALRKSLAFDYFDPLVVNRRNGMLVSGHKRLPMMIDLGFTAADVSVVDYDDATHFARMIAANTHLGEFEETMLAQLAGEIDASGIDSALTGLDEKAFMALLDGPSVVDETENALELVSKAEELQARWQVQLGDLFQIGQHRLLCGDCAAPGNWQRLLDGRQLDLVWTDPPYNVAYEKAQQRRNDLNVERGKTPHNKALPILNDDVSPAEYAALLQAWFSTVFQVTKSGGAIYCAHADSHGTATRIREPRNTGNGLHPTVKPLTLVARQVWNSSRRGETVGELFGGSGTTLAACEQTGRRCVAHELDPKYCAVILERLAAYGLAIEKIHAAN